MSEDLTWMPAWRLRDEIAAGSVTSREVVDHFLSRIERLDPSLHAFLTVDADEARRQATLADAALQNGSELGPLHGVPFAIMDGLRARGLECPMWGGTASLYDAIPLERMRAAGGILLGLTTSYYWDPVERPRNPWNTDLDSGNSSRGSAIAVAAGLAPITLGMDGAGSTRLPASWCGVIGVHPSRSLVPHFDAETPGMPILNTVGPMTRDVRDAALVLGIIAGPDGRDPTSLQADVPDYLGLLDAQSTLRAAWTDDFGWSKSQWVDESPGIVETARQAALDASGDRLAVDVVDTRWDDIREAMTVLGSTNPALIYSPPIDSADIAERVRATDEAWGWEGDSSNHFEDLADREEAPVPSPDSIAAAAESLRNCWQQFKTLLSQYDVVLSPTTPMQPRTLREWGFGGRNYTMTSYSAHTAMFNILGFPAVTVPCGFLDGLPVGIQIASLPGQEAIIFQVANALTRRFAPDSKPPLAVVIENA